MFSNPDEKINKELINWCGENVNGQFITTDPYEEDLIDILEEAEADYQESGNWNLIYVKDMAELIKADPTNGYYPTAIRSEIQNNKNLINEYNREKAAEDAKKAADAAKKAAKKAKK